MDRQNVVYPFHGMLFGHEKGYSTDTSYNLDEHEHMLTARSQAQKATYCIIPSLCVHRHGEHLSGAVAGRAGEMFWN